MAKHPRFDQIQSRILRAQSHANVDLKGRKKALATMEKIASTRVIFILLSTPATYTE